MLVPPGDPQRNRKLEMKENSISSSLLPVTLDYSPRVIWFFMVDIVPHGWYYSLGGVQAPYLSQEMD